MLGFIIFGFMFIFLGLGVHVFKWYFLISGYNTMPKDKKANVDIKGLARLIGIYAYVNGGIFILAGILFGLGIKSVVAPTVILFVVLTFYVLIKAQRYDGNIFDEAGKLRKGAGKQFILPAGIMVIALTFVAIILILSSKETEISFHDEGLEIHGMYGEIYKWEDIRDVKLMNELPTIELKTNGSALGSKLKGYFRTSELGQVKLFVNKNNPPFICLETMNGVTIFNLDDSDETKSVYGILKEVDK